MTRLALGAKCGRPGRAAGIGAGARSGEPGVEHVGTGPDAVAVEQRTQGHRAQADPRRGRKSRRLSCCASLHEFASHGCRSRGS